MQPAARIAAAIDILDDMLARHRPAADALADWSKSHRFAGSGDRNAIGGLVYDALRRRSSIAWRMGSDSPRALALGAAAAALAITPETIADLCTGTGHAPAPLTDEERRGLSRGADDAPPHIQADVPEWLWPSFERALGAAAVAEGRALAERAPTDVRVNTLKATRERVLKALQPFAPAITPLSPVGVRLAAPVGPARAPNLIPEAAYQAGWIEMQDEGSQVAALLAGAGPRQQVLDICAGGGGKTLAMAAGMQNTGQIYAYDSDRTRLKPIFERIKRAGVRNAQVLRAGDEAALLALGPRFDVVLVDAPCSGTGVWRRRPESKWRLKPPSIANRQADQRAVLALARQLVKPGGRIAYVTCSLLVEENGERIAEFLAGAPELVRTPWRARWQQAFGTKPPASSAADETDLLLTPGRHGTDGFFISLLERRP